MKFNIKKYIPHIAAIISFAIISIVYFNPVLKGKVVSQGDMQSYEGMAKSTLDFRAKYHKEPLWTNSMFSGMPTYMIASKKPNNYILKLSRLVKDVLPYPANVIFLSMLCFFILMLVFKTDPLLGAIGAVAYGLSSYFFIITAAGHVTKSFAMAFIPLVVAGVVLTFKKKYLKGTLLFMIALGLELVANHVQITYYLLLTLIILIIVYFIKFIKEKDLKGFFKPVVFLIIATVLCVLPNAQNILTLHQFTKYSSRGKSNLTTSKTKSEAKTGLTKSYITQWSYGIDETFSLMIPDVNGGATGAIGQNHPKALSKINPQFAQYIGQMDEYWGNQPFTAGPIYFGAIIMFLFILGLFYVKGYYKVWIVIATILSIMLAWGKNFMPLTDLFINFVPLYDKFRTVTMILVIAQLCVPILAVLVLKKIIDNTEYIKQNIKRFYWGTGIAAGICILYLILPSLFTDFLKNGEYQQLTHQLRQAKLDPGQISLFIQSLVDARKSILDSDAIRSLIFIIISAGLVWAYIKGKLKRKSLLVSILILVVIDLWTVDKRYLNKKNYVDKSEETHPFQPSRADLQIMQDTTKDYRVINLAVNTFNDASTSYYHQSVGGYNAAKLMRYQELIDHDLSQPNMNMKVLDMLNTKYFIVPGKDKQPIAQRNPNAMGNVWFVKKYELVPSADSAIASLRHFNPKTEAIVNNKFKQDLKEFNPNNIDSTATIKLTNFRQNRLIYSYNSKTPQLAVFSEIYYPKGWHAYIDGKPAPYFLANFVLRSMVIPAGKHTITFKFHPKIYYLGNKLSLIGSILFCLVIIALIVGLYMKGKENAEELNV